LYGNKIENSEVIALIKKLLARNKEITKFRNKSMFYAIMAVKKCSGLDRWMIRMITNNIRENIGDEIWLEK